MGLSHLHASRAKAENDASFCLPVSVKREFSKDQPKKTGD